MSWFVTEEKTIDGRRLMAFAPLELTEEERLHVDAFTSVSLRDWLKEQSTQKIRGIAEMIGCSPTVQDIHQAATSPVTDEGEEE